MKPDDKIPPSLLPFGFTEQKFAVPAEIARKGHATAVRMGDAESGITIIMIQDSPVMFRSGLTLYVGEVMRDLYEQPGELDRLLEAFGVKLQIEWLKLEPFYDLLESKLDSIIDKFGTQVDGNSSLAPIIRPDPNLPLS